MYFCLFISLYLLSNSFFICWILFRLYVLNKKINFILYNKSNYIKYYNYISDTNYNDSYESEPIIFDNNTNQKEYIIL